MTASVRPLIRRLVAIAGWPVRVQWFVRNVAPALGPGVAPSPPPGVTVRLGSAADGAALAPLVRGRESMAWRLARGDIVLVAEQGGQVVGCTWLTRLAFRPSYFPVLVSPGPGEWYNYGLALLRSHRTRGLGRLLSRMAMAHAGRRGGTSVFGHASRFNRIAAASHRAAGFITVEDVIGLTVFDRFTVVLHRRPRARGG